MTRFTPGYLTHIPLIKVPIFSQATGLSVSSSLHCEDAAFTECSISFYYYRPSTNPINLLLLIPPQWTFSSLHPSSSCTFASNTLVLSFSAGIQAISCVFIKKANSIIPPTLIPSHGLTLPSMAYYSSQFDVIPVVEGGAPCTDVNSPLTCLASLFIPKAAGDFIVESTSLVTFTCPNGVEVTFTTRDYTPPNMDIVISLNKYMVTISEGLRDSQGSIQCGIAARKQSYYSPHFTVSQIPPTTTQPVKIYQYDKIALRRFIPALSVDCLDTSSSVCTLIYDTPILQLDPSRNAPFQVNIPFFYNRLDPYPKLLQSDEITGTSSYSQRFLKLLTVDDEANYQGTPISPVYVSGPFMDLTSSLHINGCVFKDILKIEHDSNICADPTIPFCRVYMKSKYVGYKLSLSLVGSPFLRNLSVIDSIDCRHNMTILPENPNEIIFAPSTHKGFLGSDQLVSPPNGEEYMVCSLDYSISYTTTTPDAGSIVSDAFYISAYVEHWVNLAQNRIHIPLPKLPIVDVRFSILPFELTIDPLCSVWYLATCLYHLTISPNHPMFAAAATLAEKNNIFQKSFMRSVALPLYNLRTPEPLFGETMADMVSVSTRNAKLIEVNVSALPFASSGTSQTTTVHYAAIDVKYITSQLNFEDFFMQDSDGNYIDAVITLSYTIASPHSVITPPPEPYDLGSHTNGEIVLQDIYLFGYNNVQFEAPYDVLYHIHDKSKIVYDQLFSISPDLDSCADTNVSFCFLTVTATDKKYWIHRDPVTGAVTTDDMPNSFILKSVILSISSEFVIAISPEYSNYVISAELLTPRVDTITGEPNLELQWNITVSPTFNQDTESLRLALHKRVGASGVLRTEALSIFGHYAVEQGDGSIVNQYDTLNASGLSSLARVVYSGDIRIQSGVNCANHASNQCLIQLMIYTNHLLPDTQLGKINLPQLSTGVHQSVFSPCQHVKNIATTPEEQLALAKAIIIKYDPVTNDLTLFSSAPIPGVFDSSNPLFFDSNLYSSFLCEVLIYKKVQMSSFTTLTPPTVLMGIDYSSPEYNMYPIPRGSVYRRKLPSFEYHPIIHNQLEDCRTPKLSGHTVCTMQVIISGTNQYPVKNMWSELNNGESETSPVFWSSLLYAFSVYPEEACELPYTKPGSDYFSRTGDIVIYLTDDRKVKFEYPLYKENGNTNSPIIGYFAVIFELCDPRPVRMYLMTEILPEYQTTLITGYMSLRYSPDLLVGLDNVDPETGLLTEIAVLTEVNTTSYVNYDPLTHTSNDITSDTFQFPRIILGRSLEVSTEHPRVYEATIVNVTYHFYLQGVRTVEINRVLGDFSTEDTKLPCYTSKNEIFALLQTIPSLGMTKMQLTPEFIENYEKDSTCTIMLPVNQFHSNYELNNRNIKHAATVAGHNKPIFAYSMYPYYSPTATIHQVNSKSDAGNSANYPHFSPLCVFIGIFTTILLNIYF